MPQIAAAAEAKSSRPGCCMKIAAAGPGEPGRALEETCGGNTQESQVTRPRAFCFLVGHGVLSQTGICIFDFVD